MNYYDPLAPPPIQVPARRAFAAHDVRRIPVTLTDEAQSQIDSSSAEGRKFPQALAEIFGALPRIKEVQVAAAPRSQHFESGPAHFHPITGEEDRLLLITIIHKNDGVEGHRFILNMKDLQEIHPAGQLGFTALATAQELVRLYPHKGR